MDTAALIWIIVGVLVVAIIVVVTLALTARGRAEQKRRAEHDKAEKLRAEARENELAARESEARAAQTRADAASAAAAAQQAQAQAAQAEVDARRLADSVDEHDTEAAERRAAQQETLRKADDVDPYVTTDGDHDRDRDDRAEHTATRGGLGHHTDDRTAAATTPRDDRAEAYEGVPAARDGVVGRDASADGSTDAQAPAITRPPATTTAEQSVSGDDTVPPTTRRDRA